MGQGLRCYAWSDGGVWEARCVDLDLAVAARTRDEVKRLLNEAIRTYIEDASKEAPADRDRLLRRKAPLLDRVGFQLLGLAARLRHHREDGNGRSHRQFFHCHA